MKKPLIILTGPTAVGKTALSISLAKAVNGEIISADSMQVYQKMNIGTAKITPGEMDGIKHHLIDVLDPSLDFNIFLFKDLALKAMDEIYAKGKVPVIAGGTGFYIQSVLYDIEFDENDADTDFRNKMYEIAKIDDGKTLHAMLREKDPVAADEIPYQNIKRVVRALEYYHQTGKRISEHNEEQRKKESPYNFVYFVLNDDREILYDRINRRVDKMFASGLLKEVEGLINEGYHKDLISMKGIGYKELFEYFEGNCTLEEAVCDIKKNTRHFAKRQLTWFKREKDVTMVNIPDFDRNHDKMLEYMITQIKEKGIIQ